MPNETTYEIHIRNVLDEKWSSYFVPLTLTFGTDETILTGVVHDQAELFGILLKIRDSGLTLVALMPLSAQ
ncbi:MAG: hypothetical protein E4H27_04385 [Anaerolineales bacterium]|nr:MAG: hypothetical protein E4H27_04385 [Anaerolineales bacterium]